MRALMPVTWRPPPVTYRAAHCVIGAAGIFPSPGGPTCHDDHCCVLVATTFLLRANSIFDSRPRCGGANLRNPGRKVQFERTDKISDTQLNVACATVAEARCEG